MIERKRSTRKAWFILSGLLSSGAGAVYFALHPPLPSPLPSYLKPPPGSEVLMSRRLNLLQMGGPDYYCRIHSPLDAWQTAYYMNKAGVNSQRALAASRLDQSPQDMGGWALQRTGSFIGLSYQPWEMLSQGNVPHSTMRVWPEPGGSTIELYLESRFP